MVASFVHIWANDINPDVTRVNEESSAAIKIRKQKHSQLLELVYDYSDGKISESDYNLVHQKFVTDYRTAKANASLLIKEEKRVEALYKINNFQNLEQFLYGIGLGITIFFSGIVILLLSFKISNEERKFGLLASTSVLSVGGFWISWAIFPNGDYSKIGYYAVVFVVSTFVILSIWFLLKSIKTTNQKIQSAISFTIRARKSFFSYLDNEPSKSLHKSKDEYDDDFFETLNEVSK